MLSKEICKRCMFAKYPKWLNWANSSDVWCGLILTIRTSTAAIGWVNDRKDPPKDCPYFLEQTLYSMSQETEGKQDVK